MDITVILCTYNRCQGLAQALASVAASRLSPSIEWEVLVIDNNSRDRTSEIVAEFSHEAPNRFRYKFEPRQGKSFALNTAIQEAKGDVLAFIDDDVIVAPDWLENLTAPLLSREWVGVGGRILIGKDLALPQWLDGADVNTLSPLVMFDLGIEQRPLTQSPYGANMAFQREMFVKYGNFRTDLGPQPGSEIRGEDSEFANRLLRAGERLCYEPSAVVYHPVSQGRLSKEYFLSWWYDKGRSDIRASMISESRSFIPPALVTLRRLVRWSMRWMLTTATARRFSSKLIVWYLAGQIAELRARLRKAQVAFDGQPSFKNLSSLPETKRLDC